MSKQRKSYSAAFKAKVALATQRQDKTISQQAAQFKVHPIVISRWKAQLLDNAEQVFQDKRSFYNINLSSMNVRVVCGQPPKPSNSAGVVHVWEWI